MGPRRPVDAGLRERRNGDRSAEIDHDIECGRLRDLRGTVVVDFLRTGEASRRAVVDTLAASTAIDRRRVGLLGWTRGGLFELRRGEDLARE